MSDPSEPPSHPQLIVPEKKVRKVIIKKPKIEKNIKIEDPDNKKKTKKNTKCEKPSPNQISFHNYNILNEENEKSSSTDYKVAELKEMCAIIQRDFDYKKIKLSGTKGELRQSVYNFYHHTLHCIKIQL